MKSRPYIFGIVLILISLGMSCGVGKTVTDMMSMGDAIEEEFGHKVFMGLTWDDGVSSMKVNFVSFETDSIPYMKLEVLAEEVYLFMTEEYRQVEDQDYILIRFSPEEEITDDTINKVEFRFDN